jgi:hypothetical protein
LKSTVQFTENAVLDKSEFSRALMKVSNYGKRFSIARQLHPNSMSLLRDFLTVTVP